MKLYVLNLLCFLSFLGISHGATQNDSVSYHHVTLMGSDYKDFVFVEKNIYAISQNNDLVEIDLRNDSFKLIKNNITALAKKSNNELLFGSKDGKLFTLNKRKKIKQIDEIDAEIFSILINSKDEYVAYTNKSIYYNKKNYVPNKETNFYGKVLRKYSGTQLIEPDYIFLDKMNFIWFAFNEGEWGGNVCFFDLNTKEFIYEKWLSLDDDDDFGYNDNNDYFKKLKEKYPELITVTERDTIYKYPYNLGISIATKGVAYNNSDELFITSSGVGHTIIYHNENDFRYYVDGTIIKISKKEKDYFTSCYNNDILEEEKYKYAFSRDFRGWKNKDRNSRESILAEDEINKLSAITFNKYDNNLYFFCSKGFYILNNSDCAFSKELYFSPKITCLAQFEEDYCTHLNVTKFEFISEKELLFLTVNNGIGYYNGDVVKYFR